MKKNSETKITAKPNVQEITIERTFDAPLDLVFKLWTDPKLIPQWWGPKFLTTTVDTMEVRSGGKWRFIHKDENGNEYAFHGVYHEITPSARIVDTFEFEGMPGHVMLEITEFEDVNGKTKITSKSIFQSLEDRDGMLKTGMERGATESTDRFAELLANA